jgi:long-subunit fatty acid transport protein
MATFRISSALALLLALCHSNLLADDLHYNNILIGDRASGLAGAYTAISDDASGLFYNPAGIVFTESLQLSASANALYSTELVYKDVLNGGDWKRKSDSIVPNYFGMTTKLGNGYLGFSYAVTDFESEDQDQEFTTIPDVDLFVINVNNSDKVTKFGPSYAVRLNDEWDFGVTLYWHERDKEIINNQFIRLPDGRFESTNVYFETDESGYEPVIGLMWSPDDSLSFGLSVRQTFITSSSTRSQVTCASDVNDPNRQISQCINTSGTINNPTIRTTNDKRDLPLNVRFGVAYFQTPRLLYSADISYFEEVRSSTYDAEEVINYAFGVEYYLDAAWAIRGGIYTNNANTPELSPDEVNQFDHVDLTGISLSISRFSASSSVTLGFAVASGDGEAQVVSGSSEIQDLEQTTETLYLSTAYNF